MATLTPTEKVRLTAPLDRHSVAHAIKVHDGPVIKTRCGWQPKTTGEVMNLGDAIKRYDAFCCRRCFS